MIPTDEQKKGIFDVEEACHFKARYHQGILPADVPRLFGVNCGKDQAGDLLYDDWFDNQGMLGAAALARGDAEFLEAASGHLTAQARRVVIFNITTSWKRGTNKTKEGRKAAVDAGIEREKQLRGR